MKFSIIPVLIGAFSCFGQVPEGAVVACDLAPPMKNPAALFASHGSVDSQVNKLDSDGEFKQASTLQTEFDGKKLMVKISRYPASESPSRGTIIFLCGGPRDCSWRPNVPKGYDVVTFDPLGIGANRISGMSPALKSVESQAVVVKKIVEGFKLKNYIIMGQSFGTATATIAAAQIGRAPSLAQPSAVILEGIMGPRRNGTRDFGGTATRAWDLLPEDQREQFVARFNQFGKEHPDGVVAMKNAMYGLLQEGPKITADTIQRLNKQNFGEWDEWSGHANKILSERVDWTSKNEMYKAAGCQVIRHVQDPSTGGKMLFDPRMDLENPNLVDEEYCFCRTVPRDYNPCVHQIKAPIIYINGDHDPLTPIRGARKHFDCETSTQEKVFLTVKDGGHLQTEDWGPLNSCVNTIYSAVSSRKVKSLSPTRDWSQGCKENSPPAPAANAVTH